MHSAPPRPGMTTRWPIQTVHFVHSAPRSRASWRVLCQPGLRNYRGRIYLDHPFWTCQGRYNDAGRYRVDTFEPMPDYLIDGIAVANVGEVNDDLDDVFERRP